MRVLWCLALVFGVSLGADQRWKVEKTRQCSCSSNATDAFLSAVPRTCLTDSKSRRARLRLSAPEEGGCQAKVMEDPGEIDIHLTYNGKLRSASLSPAEPEQVEFVLKVDVASGQISYPRESPGNIDLSSLSLRNPDPSRRKRDLADPQPGSESSEPDFVPFSTATFTITLNMDQEPDCEMEDLIKQQMTEGVKAFWLKMTNCLLDVTE